MNRQIFQTLSFQRPFQQLGQPLRGTGKTGNLHCGNPLGGLGIIIGLAPIGNGQ